jgi:hypothetical protein
VEEAVLRVTAVDEGFAEFRREQTAAGDDPHAALLLAVEAGDAAGAVRAAEDVVRDAAAAPGTAAASERAGSAETAEHATGREGRA